MLVFFSMIRLPLPGAKAILTRWVCTDLIFEILREYILDLCDVFCSGQTQNCAGNHASLEQLLRVIWETGFWAVVLSLAQIKSFSVPVMSCLLIIFLNSRKGEGRRDRLICRSLSWCCSPKICKTMNDASFMPVIFIRQTLHLLPEAEPDVRDVAEPLEVLIHSLCCERISKNFGDFT